MKPLGSELSYKQFLFCEEYLRNFNARQAFKVAYPNCKHHGETNVMKSRKVVDYIKARLEEKKATIERLTDKMHSILYESMLSPDSEIALEATKQISKLLEIKARISELDNKVNDNEPININFKVV